MTCPKCGGHVGFDDRFCAKCGTVLQGPQPQLRKREKKPLSVVCPLCRTGAEIEAIGDQTTCPSCAETFETKDGLALAQDRLQRARSRPARRRLPMRERSSGGSNDTLALVMGILGLTMCPIFSLVAWGMGSSGSAGRILGIIGTALWTLCFLIILAGGLAH